MTSRNRLFRSKYGYFDHDGREFVITRPDTPTPWVNVISNEDYGLVISQAGSGFSWRGNSALARINVWHQDLIRDEYGKYVYIRDDQSGDFWSIGWKPCCPKFEKYEVRHGMGYTQISCTKNGIEATQLVFVPQNEPLEIWKITLRNRSKKKRELSLFTYLEWCLGNWTDTHREFHRTFIETMYERKLNCLWGKKRPLPVPSHISTGKPEVSLEAFHSVNMKPKSFEGDKKAFLGPYGRLGAPSAVRIGSLSNATGEIFDPIAGLHVKVFLKAGEEKVVVFTLGSCREKEAEKLIKKYRDPEEVDGAFNKTINFWEKLISGVLVQTPDPAFNLMTNYWLKYQAISGHTWSRTGYYQCSGAYGFRDQLQSSLALLPLKPELTRRQILLHAKHQFKDGTVHHWWHPILELAYRGDITDNLLWLPYILLFYLDETGDHGILDEKVSFVDGGEASLYEHCIRAIERVLSRFSRRGLPLIGAGDWNDGLSAVGLKWKGESIWLGHFLYGILKRFAPLCKKMSENQRAARYEKRAEELKKAINRYGWDGSWYWRASRDNGKLLGSSKCKEGKIYLNAQTWSVINETAPKERVEKAMRSVETVLLNDFGPLLLYPAYTKPDETIGYITRYAPGLRENGGVYTHAAVWAVLAECKLKKAENAYEIYTSICPPRRSVNPDKYQAEPYVMPGNIDGPQSPSFGRGGWTWYTGSAAWLFKISTEWILGIRPTEKGLVVDPCVPKKWGKFKISRRFRGAEYEIEIENPNHVTHGVKEIILDGKPLTKPYLPVLADGKKHKVKVKMG